MSLKDNWTDKIDGFDVVEARHINEIAHSVMKNEEDIVELKKSKIKLATTLDGNEEDKAPSVKAVNEELDKLGGRIARNDKRITNIEQGIPPELFETDSSVAYKKDVPKNALPYAEISKIGGMTRKCTNLIPFPYESSSKTSRGITYTVNGDGSVHIKGTCTAQSDFLVQYNTPLTLPAGTYVISGNNGSIGVLYASIEGIGLVYSTGNGTSFTLTKETPVQIAISVYEGDTVDKTIYPMLNEGETALPYEPYFEGLRSAKATEVESVGVNLVHSISAASNTTLTDGVVTQIAADTYETIMLSCQLYTDDNYQSGGVIENLCTTGLHSATFNKAGAENRLVFGINGKVIDTKIDIDITNLPIGEYTISANFTNITQGSISWKDIMLNKGTTAQPYRPYSRNTLPIPEAVRPAHGINNEVYDYLDFGEQESVKRVGVVDLGTLTWRKGSFAGEFLSELEDDAVDMGYGGACLCSKYSARYSNNDKSVYTTKISSKTGCVVVDTDYTDAASFKAAMSGVMFVYELVTPEVIDISDILPADNFIEVEGGGTITAVNENGFDVPSEITYMLEEETV